MRRWLLAVFGVVVLGLGPAPDVVAGQEGAPNPPPDRPAGRAAEGRRGGAQAARPGPGGRQAPLRGGPMTPQQLDQAFDRFMITQARNALQLTEQQHRDFGPRLERLQMIRRRAQRQRRQLVGEVNALTQGSAPIDDATVTAKLKAIEDQNARAEADIRRAYEAIDAVLTPAQRLRFRGFEVRMEQRKLELIRQAQQRQRPPASPPAQ